MNRLISFAAIVLLASLSISAEAGNPSRGQELAGEVCQSCHGMDGNLVLSDEYPRLGGQHEDYLVMALKAYRSGDRQNAIMSSFAQNLSDRDIADLAAWFARQDGLVELKID